MGCDAELVDPNDMAVIASAAAKAIRHGNDPKSGLLGYDADFWAQYHETVFAVFTALLQEAGFPSALKRSE